MPKKKHKRRAESELEREFITKFTERHPTNKPIREYHFHPTRKFRFDFAWPSKKVALEVHGYGPGHFSLEGMTKDFDKHMLALELNWKVIYLTSRHLTKTKFEGVMKTLEKLLSLPSSYLAPTHYIPRNRYAKNYKRGRP